MANPKNSFTVFDFYCDSFEELPAKLTDQVGYKVPPTDVWNMTISEVNRKLHITLTIIYWDPEKARAN